MAGFKQALDNKIQEFWRFCLYFWRQYEVDDCRDTAAALTYQTLFAVVPLLTVLYTFFSLFPQFGGLEGKVENFLFSNIVPENVAKVQEYLSSFADQARRLSVVSIVFLAVTAFLMLHTIERAFNEIWRVTEPRHGLQKFLLYWAVLSLGPLMILFGVALSTYVFSLPLISTATESTSLLTVLEPVADLSPFMLSVGVFTLIYATVPNCAVPFRHALYGGVLTAVVFYFAKAIFAFATSKFAIEIIYGTFASVPLFLLWIYVSWNIILAGAVLVRIMSVYEDETRRQAAPHLFQVLMVLEALYRAHVKGDVIREKDIVQGDLHIDLENWADYRTRLLELNLIKRTEKSGFVLSRDLSEVNVWDLYAILPWQLPEKPEQTDNSWKRILSNKLASISTQTREDLNLDLETLFRGKEADSLAAD